MYDGSNGGMNSDPNSDMNTAGPSSNPVPPPSPSPLPPPPPVTPLPMPGAVNALTINDWLKRHWKLLLLIFVAVVLLGETIFQIVYPANQLIPGTRVDGLDVGSLRKRDAAKKLDDAYGGLTLKIFFGKNQAAFQKPEMKDVGIGVDNSARVETMNYPFYLRMIPGSIFWAGNLEKPGDIAYTYDKNKIASYTTSQVGTDCSIPPQNATLKLVESQLQLVPALSGGTCDITQFQQTLATVKPDPDKDNSVRIDIDETPAPVTDDMARALAATLNGRLASPMPITVDKSTDSVPGRVVMGWLDFTAYVPEQSIDNSANQQASLKFSVNQDRMKDYLDQGIAAKLIVKPGVNRVSTLDFKETSRVNGTTGRDLNIPAIAKSVMDYINNKTQRAIGATTVVGPSTIYTRKYTPTSVGFSALLAQYAHDNPGTWGLAFTELNGVRYPRSASYNAGKPMKAAGVHSLYLAYTYVMQKYAGVARPVDTISGSTNATDCFKLMIQQADTGCTRGFYSYFGYAQLASRGKELGLGHTTFAGDDTMTSAGDLQKVMVGLFKDTIAREQDGESILSAARTGRNNDGIPAGAGRAQVTHLTGESGTIHNDTAIIYDSNYGAYALTVMSDGSSWDKVADLVKKIEDLKSVKVPEDAR